MTEAGHSTLDHETRNLSPVHKTVTRRRGACKRCQTRKVRCDGKNPCSECSRLSFECRYVSSLRQNGVPRPRMHRQTRLISEESPALSSHLLETQPGTFEHGFPYELLEQELDLDIFTGSSTEVQCLHIPAGEHHPAGSDDRGRQPEIDLFPEFAHDIETAETAHVGCHISAAASEEEPVREDTTATPRFEREGLFKDRLLDEIQEHCELWHDEQSKELAESLTKLITHRIGIYPRGNLDGCIANENAPRHEVHREVAFACVDECMNDWQGGSCFLDRNALEAAVRDMLDQSPLATEDLALAHATIALGGHLLSSNNAHDMSGLVTPSHVVSHFNYALEAKANTRLTDFSMRSLELAIMMAYLAISIGSSEASRLLSEALHYVQLTGTHRSRTIARLCSKPADGRKAKRAVWFLYALENTFRLRDETFSAFDETFMDYGAPPPERYEGITDWLPIQCRYARLCASIHRQSYGQKPAWWSEDSSAGSDTEQQLSAWLACLPAEYQPTAFHPLDAGAALSAQERRAKLNVLFQYYEALSMIATGRKPSYAMDSLDASHPWLSDARRSRASWAKEILAAGCHLTPSDVRYNLNLYRVMCIATGILVVESIRSDAGDPLDVSYLATAAGFFGRMALDNIEGPVEDIMTIVRITQHSLKQT